MQTKILLTGKASQVFKQLAIIARYAGARTLKEVGDVH